MRESLRDTPWKKRKHYSKQGRDLSERLPMYKGWTIRVDRTKRSARYFAYDMSDMRMRFSRGTGAPIYFRTQHLAGTLTQLKWLIDQGWAWCGAPGGRPVDG